MVNPLNGCEYTLYFRTNAVCMDVVSSSLSGGWVFLILFLVALVSYSAGGALWTYQTTGKWAFPHAALWSSLDDLLFEGTMYVLHGFKRPAFLDTGDKVNVTPVFYSTVSSSQLKAET